ncbi:hypothetical protein CO134_01970 [Candidatus Kuenenbacteria bacterium CG_4_9_14_3_um_filter_39_14]|uniref:Uncharacterized protein n=6 Tax=Candidatus Kueneniibacteriota TaxID=1752740 RepID=A0A2M7MGZ7_9BACT|nr:hypothetical protein [Candidatus Kuenenbacteria bacterium]OIP56044.1 MAG: hypothetical protein AUK13_01715 [Candidatus Kuenenbacteria bacterium CG2_30_39_24]PIP29064.1 MAG: hypothetical protein COX28_01145 [Candidatus Kuenenbacteria bacterium CG23_combo_of_CG06-09_8_20_14_all_39_39]PIP75312.1 MAG: hypothetical protein COW86_04575 [Candidatus Kuenenbacteria bacterium CG22_combo_CG10-13_8_21_14_all_39_9]PIR81098.1 MAG: hypothetical protein COU24_00540 [Candidatus Kuenenbacteria bacterium CG10_
MKVKRAWLDHIVKNKDRYTKYHETWDNWLADRKQEIGQQELFDKFGIRKTADFRQALIDHKIKKAEKWLKYIEDNIEDNKDLFPRYSESWFQDRYSELKQAQK